jgi:hypothetical protein
MIRTVSQIRDEMADREAIRDCLYRYSRGIDRCDMEMLRSAYWPDAIDDHTGFRGDREEFIAWAYPRLRSMEQNVHMIGNILIRLDGDKAAVESYLWSVSVVGGETRRAVFVCGRYLDKFERRNDEWRIAGRLVVHDWFRDHAVPGEWEIGPFDMKGLERGTIQPNDKSYNWLGLV